MFAAFRDAAAHMATLVHECAHATGARHRLDRNFEERFRRDAVAVEECVADFRTGIHGLHPRRARIATSRGCRAAPETERLAHAEAFIGNLGIYTVFGSEGLQQARDRHGAHARFRLFQEAAGFYGSWIHECGHGSGAKHRLDRDLSGRFGSEAYALEEISVELLSGMILADLGIAHHPRPDHAAYVASWLQVLKDDPRAIFTAAGKAQQAADWMHARQPQATAQAA